MLDVFNLDKSYISRTQIREVFKKGKNYSRKKIVPIRIPALTNKNIEKRKRFV